MSNVSAGSFVSPVSAYANGYTPTSGPTNGFPGAATGVFEQDGNGRVWLLVAY